MPHIPGHQLTPADRFGNLAGAFQNDPTGTQQFFQDRQNVAGGGLAVIGAGAKKFGNEAVLGFMQSLRDRPELTKQFLGGAITSSVADDPEAAALRLQGGEFQSPEAQAAIAAGLGGTGFELSNGQIVPQTGTIGSETVLNEGFDDSGDIIKTATGDALDLLGEGEEAFDPFLQAGQGANTLQADLSGANGPEAQARAFANFQESPGTEFLRSRGEKALESRAGRFGDFGGNFQKGLSQFNQDIALQDLQRQLAQLGEVSSRGFGAAQGTAGLAQTGAGITERAGANTAQLRTQLARDLSSGRIRASELIAQHVAGTVEGVAAGQEALGGGLSDLLGSGASVVANILQTAGLTAAQQDEALALLLGNLAVQQGTSSAGFSAQAGNTNAFAKLASSQAVTDAVTNMITALDLGGGTE